MFKRPARAGADDAFLLAVYAQARHAELAAFGWNKPQLASFVSMQFEQRQRAHRARYPHAEHSIIVIGQHRAGELWAARTPEGIVLVDLALLARFRNRGFGTQLLRELIAEARGRRLPLRLSLRADSSARRLCQRLGFTEKAERAGKVDLEHEPEPKAAARSGERRLDGPPAPTEQEPAAHGQQRIRTARER